MHNAVEPMKTYRSQKYLNVNADAFITVSSPEHAYLLGFIWADGTVLRQPKQKSIRIEIIESDMQVIKHVLEVTGKWNFSTRTRSGRSPQMTAECNNAKLVDFLWENDYGMKSVVSPEKILNLIPTEYVHYFYRGWSDGDGCFYNGKTSKAFTMSGSYNYDWISLTSLLESHNIRYSLSRRVAGKNQYSYVRISNKKGIRALGELLYSGQLFGLDRKKTAFDAIVGGLSSDF